MRPAKGVSGQDRTLCSCRHSTPHPFSPYPVELEQVAKAEEQEASQHRQKSLRRWIQLALAIRARARSGRPHPAFGNHVAQPKALT